MSGREDDCQLPVAKVDNLMVSQVLDFAFIVGHELGDVDRIGCIDV